MKLTSKKYFETVDDYNEEALKNHFQEELVLGKINKKRKWSHHTIQELEANFADCFKK